MRYERHRSFIRSLPCLICGDDVHVECAHIRMSDARIAKKNPGSKRPHDAFTVPLCSECHREQHSGSEYEFWKTYEIDVILIALALWQATGNHQHGLEIINSA